MKQAALKKERKCQADVKEGASGKMGAVRQEQNVFTPSGKKEFHRPIGKPGQRGEPLAGEEGWSTRGEAQAKGGKGK